MARQQERFHGDAGVLHQRAVRIPLPDEDAERLFHKNVTTIVASQERKADLLADPDVPLLTAYEEGLDYAVESFERRLRQIAGEDYEEVAMAYFRGEREDSIAEVTAYFLEGIWRIQQWATVTEMVYAPLLVRYPDSFTLNIRFASGFTAPGAVHYESPEHCDEELPDAYLERYHQESQYSQRRAAEYLRSETELAREEFPHPDETTFEERKYGGILTAGGRRGSTFSALFESVDPDPDRFSEPATEPTLVEAGPEARRTERRLGLESEIVH
ncbi:hypothetical protein [Natronolimnohabitans innermongolicus]|uniref:Uncharacterized protein n=1 Tax=Natronolimnohabitans innermongolicus JCM 12255 TaxID=1227499 RepID=L9XIP4_9EURY|nr:hypothetical protein [Natronolimnohabitans innermongolicus]ELY61614.1 hypothetical protein C493_02081 [Natronolimnohabitans innermongolicus JCM 12255]